ncbi:hypothetical protein BDV98DRAFT_573850 [Pterulicium gracile]|uniref:GST N-terminal domain-containing protein n=1 Tax=Pterulicium gracile TaxID=1884261 RepID=A0A5C3QHL8_9AGAR|nr:hypothetical protein BDV98DRAFT_573850 [Pterula gracilis]
MHSTKIVLYELSSGLPDGKPLSPWSTTVRCALNYRQLSHRTELIPLRAFQALAVQIGAKPTTTFPDGSPKYTTPTIVDSTNCTPSSPPIVLSESIDILQYIERTYPDASRPLFTSIAVDRLAQEAVIGMLFPVLNGLDIRATYASVPDADKPTWRDRWLGGKDIDEFVADKKSEGYLDQLRKGEESWTKCAGYLGEEGGKWFGGKKPVFVDFFVLGAVSMVRDIWEEEWEGTFGRVGGGRMGRYLEDGEEYLKVRTEFA